MDKKPTKTNIMMTEELRLIRPKITPPLDKEFCPAVLANHAYQLSLANDGVPLVIGLERERANCRVMRPLFFLKIIAKAHSNLFYTERLVKFLLWQRGGYRIFIGGPSSIGDHIRRVYSNDGKQSFDHHFMSDQVYEKPFSVEVCSPSEVPPSNEGGEAIGRHLEGNRIGFDLGASDRKVSAVVEGKVIFSEEKIWNPSEQSDPAYHYNEILDSLKTAASKLDRVDAIGGSSAGVSTSTVGRWLHRSSVVFRLTAFRKSRICSFESSRN